ncbi:MAG: hypothetical protein M1817_005853 [Caeruleum heppii]|nr:MAG: hypothetical protein M1817_005853 [Caeruleum heppii]
MSFGFGGFGQNTNNQQQQSSGFGGFGGSSNTGTTGGFGNTNTGGAFGTTGNTGGGLFGGNSASFGSGGGGFGNTTHQSAPFGGQAASTSGGLFGSTTQTAPSTGGFGGFGANNASQSTSSPFGGGTATGGLFGSTNKQSAFGSNTASSGSGLFGSSNTGNSGFGSTNAAPTGGFGAVGANASTALSASNVQSTGTAGTPFAPFIEKEGTGSLNNHFQTISFLQPYQGFSLEELRLADYAQGRRYGNASNQAGAFGTNTGFGGFGTQPSSTSFGATNTGGGMFGNTNTNNTNPGFGASQPASNPFGGGSTGTGLFGGGTSKPAGGGLFGTAAAPATSTQPSGGLFGTTGTTGGFGNTGGSGFGGTGGSLFGGNNNNSNTNAAKPSGFSFGATGANTTTGFGAANTNSNPTGGFGATNNTGGGLFGNNQAGTSAFGGGTQQGNSNPFGGAVQNQTQQNQGSSLFGNNNQAKPAGGLFGNTGTQNAGGSLFGGGATNTSTAQQGSSLFNTSTQNNTGGGLFGPKPFGTAGAGTNTSGGLFGTTPANNTGGGGLFPNLGSNNTNNQQNQGGLFGNANNQQQAKPDGLFGTSLNATNNTGGGLFGTQSTNPQQPSGGLFGNANQNQQQQSGGNSLFGGSSLLGNTSQPQAQNQQPQSLSTSITDNDPYGSVQLFAGLGSLDSEKTGPLATPLSSAQKLKKSAVLPQYKMNPAASLRMITPQKRGYGFSYSNYGTPNSASSISSTPGSLGSSLRTNNMGSSLLGANLGRGLGKSLSTSNLRTPRTFDSEDSVLSPNAFSASSSRYSGAGSLKRLVINRSVRTDLFTPLRQSESAGALPAPEKSEPSVQRQSIMKKRVSFETNGTSTTDDELPNGEKESSQVNGTSATPSAREQGFLRSSPRKSANGNSHRATNGTPGSAPGQPEMEQYRGNELAIVPEDAPSHAVSSKATSSSSTKPAEGPAGEYWMKPSLDELKQLARERLKKLSDFVVGRYGLGFVKFSAPVDLTGIELDRLPGELVRFSHSSCTVYPDDTSKPPPGKGLNVPALIQLEGLQYPRVKRATRSSRRVLTKAEFQKGLETVPDTHFLSWDEDGGIWVFTVEHFTTYSFDVEDEGETGLDESVMTQAPDTPTPKTRSSQDATISSPIGQDVSMLSQDTTSSGLSMVDDTFDFKKRSLPGGFDRHGGFDAEPQADESREDDHEDQSFLDERSVGSSLDDADDEPDEVPDDTTGDREDESVMIEDEEMADSTPNHGMTAERMRLESLVARASARENLASPPGAKSKEPIGQVDDFGRSLSHNPTLDLGGGWAENLQRTISPRKVDRSTLKASQADLWADLDESQGPMTHDQAQKSIQGFRPMETSIDLMRSLFGPEHGRPRGSVLKTNKDIPGRSRGFEWPYHKKSKTGDFDEASMAPQEKAFHASLKPHWGSDGTLIYARESSALGYEPSEVLVPQGVITCGGQTIHLAKLGVEEYLPKILVHQKSRLSTIEMDGEVPKAVMQPGFNFSELAELVEVVNPQSEHEKLVWQLASVLFDKIDLGDAKPDESGPLEERLRKDRLSTYWAQLTTDVAMRQVRGARGKEEEAVLYLACHRVMDACGALLEGRNFRLATLVAMIGGNRRMRADVNQQLIEWRRLKMLSEMTDPIRALYSLLAGETCVCEGNKGAAEDRAPSFVIARRFGLDWRQSFGLRLWYGIQDQDSIGVAVEQYEEDMEEGREDHALPVPFYMEQGLSVPWTDELVEERQDVLWGLLTLYLNRDIGEQAYHLEDIIQPPNHQTSPVSFRFAWQLYQTLSVRRIARFGDSGNDNTAHDKEARLTLDYASQLETTGSWTLALFVVLHLAGPDTRKAAIQGILSRNAGRIGEPGDDTFQMLVHEYVVPEPWIWEAKALYARSVTEDHVVEVHCLLRAENWDAAHSTLCRSVAPQAIIADDLDRLRYLLGGFANVELVRGWNLGGQVYLDYLQLLHVMRHPDGSSHRSHSHPQRGLPKDNKLGDVLRRLAAALPALGKTDGKDGFLERIAMQEIGGVVGKALIEGKAEHAVEPNKILSLPLTEDAYLQHTVELSLHYYRALMAGEE